MDTFRAFEDEAPLFDAMVEEPAAEPPPPAIGSDERRMHVRAYNYWVSLLDGRAYPSIQDVDPSTLADFGPHSVLLDFTQGSEDPAIAFVGRALREECCLEGHVRNISEVPPRTLLSRLTDHYLEIIANRAPIGFEAEFVSQRGANTMYRGILMPLSSDGDAIDFICGVINWKEVADNETVLLLEREVDRAMNGSAAFGAASSIWADGPQRGDAIEAAEPGDPELELSIVLPEDAGLADRLAIALEGAEAARSADGRSRGALYRALGQAYDFALAAEQAPGDYAELLEDAGVRPQARAPMTAVAKLIFGAGYDKARLTEFAATLAHGRRLAVAEGGLTAFLEQFPGGMKAIVQCERRARRPLPTPAIDHRATLRTAPPIGHVAIDAEVDEDGLVLLIARREPDGRLALIAPIADRGAIDRAARAVTG